MESASHLEGYDAGLRWRVVRQGLELLEGTCSDCLSRAVDIGWCGTRGSNCRQDLGRVSAHNGAHARGGHCGCCSHAVGPLPNEAHGLGLGEDAREG
ncbi:hypothetical protein D3C85_1582210 [compost metagenome]